MNALLTRAAASRAVLIRLEALSVAAVRVTLWITTKKLVNVSRFLHSYLDVFASLAVKKVFLYTTM